MNNYKLYISSIIIFMFLMVSCNHDHGSHSTVDHDDHHGQGSDDHQGHGRDDHDDHNDGDDHHDILIFTAEQIKTVGLEFGDFEKLKVNQFVAATGTLGLPPNAMASVSVKAEGILSGNKIFVEGSKIKKGEVIAYLSNPEFIVLQQKYLEVTALLKLKKYSFDRQKRLMDEGAGVEKRYQEVEAELHVLEAKKMGHSKQLKYIGISTESLTVQSMRQSVAIVSPMKGFITSINFHKGMYAQPAVPLMEIISDGHLHLELDVFESDISKVSIGQKISYTLPALGDKMYDGEVTIINKEFDSKSKTIRIHGHLDGDEPLFLKDLFIKAKIWLNDDTVEALPEDAVIKEGAGYFIYAGKVAPKTNDAIFEKFMVIPGAVSNGYIEVKLIDKIPSDMKIVTKGAYYVNAQAQVGELEHNH